MSSPAQRNPVGTHLKVGKGPFTLETPGSRDPGNPQFALIEALRAAAHAPAG